MEIRKINKLGGINDPMISKHFCNASFVYKRSIPYSEAMNYQFATVYTNPYTTLVLAGFHRSSLPFLYYFFKWITQLCGAANMRPRNSSGINQSFVNTVKADFANRVDRVRTIDDGWMQ